MRSIVSTHTLLIRSAFPPLRSLCPVNALSNPVNFLSCPISSHFYVTRTPCVALSSFRAYHTKPISTSTDMIEVEDLEDMESTEECMMMPCVIPEHIPSDGREVKKERVHCTPSVLPRQHETNRDLDDEECLYNITKQNILLYHHSHIEGLPSNFLRMFHHMQRSKHGCHVSASQGTLQGKEFNRKLQTELSKFVQKAGIKFIPRLSSSLTELKERQFKEAQLNIVRQSKKEKCSHDALLECATPTMKTIQKEQSAEATPCGEKHYFIEESTSTQEAIMAPTHLDSTPSKGIYQANVWFTQEDIRMYGFRVKRRAAPYDFWIAKKNDE